MQAGWCRPRELGRAHPALQAGLKVISSHAHLGELQILLLMAHSIFLVDGRPDLDLFDRKCLRSHIADVVQV